MHRAARQCRAGRFSPPPADFFLCRMAKEKMGQGGLEPPTPRLSSVCSNQLSYWPPHLFNPGKRHPARPHRGPAATSSPGGGRGSRMKTTRSVARSRSPAHPDQEPQPGRSDAGILSGTIQPRGRSPSPQTISLKGGDPAAGSPTATLLRLHPSR